MRKKVTIWVVIVAVGLAIVPDPDAVVINEVRVALIFLRYFTLYVLGWSSMIL